MRPPSLHSSANRTVWGRPGLLSALRVAVWQPTQLGGEEFRHIRIGDCVLCRRYVEGFEPFRIIVRTARKDDDFFVQGWCFFSVHRQLRLGPVAGYPVIVFDQELFYKERRGSASYDIIVWWMKGLDEDFVKSSLGMKGETDGKSK